MSVENENLKPVAAGCGAGLGEKMVDLGMCIRLAEFMENLPEEIRKKYLVTQSVSEALRMLA